MSKQLCNVEHMRLYIAALRSGEFQQVEAALRDIVTPEGSKPPVFGYCCLGVATEVAVRNGLELNLSDQNKLNEIVERLNLLRTYEGPSWRPADWDLNHDVWNLGEGYLPNSVQRWLDIDGPSDPIIDRSHGSSAITAGEANDDLHWDFNQIADAFERRFLPEDVKETDSAPTAE